MTQRWIEDAFELAVETFERGAKQAAKQKMIPYRSENGRYVGSPYEGNGWWTGGFWPGLMWQLFHATGNNCFRDEALRVEEMLVQEFRRFNSLNHDVGFMYLLSTGAHHRLMGDAQARTDTLHAATLLAGRFNPQGFIRAWPGDHQIGYAIVDCMMNLPLLYWAGEQTGDPRFGAIAKIHADTTLREFLRDDGSCCHIVVFDPATGAALDRPAGQGYAPGSSWSRGQAWALYGFTLSAVNGGEKRYLEAARRIARYFMENIRHDGLTDCDFRQPEGEERIDNIAGAVAACALLELRSLVDKDEGGIYFEAALRLLKAQYELCADRSGQGLGILTKCTSAYHGPETERHQNILYGDYFFVEALCRLRGTDARLWMAKA